MRGGAARPEAVDDVLAESTAPVGSRVVIQLGAYGRRPNGTFAGLRRLSVPDHLPEPAQRS